MTTLATQLSAFLREHLPRDRGASSHTCETYAHTIKLLVCFAAERLRVKPSGLEIQRWLGLSLQRFGSDEWIPCRLISPSCRCRGVAQGGRSPTGAAPRQRRPLHAAIRCGRWSRYARSGVRAPRLECGRRAL